MRSPSEILHDNRYKLADIPELESKLFFEGDREGRYLAPSARMRPGLPSHRNRAERHCQSFLGSTAIRSTACSSPKRFAAASRS